MTIQMSLLNLTQYRIVKILVNVKINSYNLKYLFKILWTNNMYKEFEWKHMEYKKKITVKDLLQKHRKSSK